MASLPIGVLPAGLVQCHLKRTCIGCKRAKRNLPLALMDALCCSQLVLLVIASFISKILTV